MRNFLRDHNSKLLDHHTINTKVLWRRDGEEDLLGRRICEKVEVEVGFVVMVPVLLYVAAGDPSF